MRLDVARVGVGGVGAADAVEKRRAEDADAHRSDDVEVAAEVLMGRERRIDFVNAERTPRIEVDMVALVCAVFV